MKKATEPHSLLKFRSHKLNLLMNAMLKIFISLIPALLVYTSFAQPKVVVIADSLFDNPSHLFILTEKDSWYYRQGDDESWAAKEISMNGWKKMQPANFSENYVAHAGKAQGWFRIIIQIDSNIKSIPSGISSATWAASDLYINGKLAMSFGQTGSNGKTYKENRPFWKEPIRIKFKPGEFYTIAVHVVDYPASFRGSLKSADDFSRLLILTTPLTPSVRSRANAGLFFHSVLLAISGVISILFWFFWLLNIREKTQLLFALCCSLISFCILNVVVYYASNNISFTNTLILDFLFSICMALIQLLIFTIIINVLRYKCPRWLPITVYAMIGLVLLASQFPKLV